MKKLSIIGLAVLCVAVLFPQSAAAGVGIKGGLALSNFTLSLTEPPPFPFTSLTGPVGGVYFSIGLGPVAFQPEILYARMGAKAEYEGTTDKYQLDYIHVPVLLKLRVIPAGPVRPIVYAGGYGSYLLKAKGVMTAEGLSETEDRDDMFEKLDYGLLGGAGLEFKLPGVTLSVEGRYNLGLVNILKDVEEGDSAKNRSIMALVGIGF
jgi:hypothetical protein